MDRLAQLIEETRDVRELKRALSVKLGEAGMATDVISEVLQVTPRVVRKWRQRYEREGVAGLHVRYRGSESYLKVEQRQEVELLTSPSANLQFQLRADGSARATPASSTLVDARVPGAAKKEFEQAAALIAAGKKESLTEAIRHLEKAVNIYPQYVEANLMLGTTYMDLSQWDKAEQTLKRTVELDPHAGNALLALGELYFRQKKTEDAEKALVRGLEIENRSYQGHLALARVYFEMSTKLKDEAQVKPVLEKAYEQVNQSLRLKPDFAQAHLVKGNLLLRVRRAADAQREFEEYLRLDPKGPFADQTRAVVEKISKALAAEKKP